MNRTLGYLFLAIALFSTSTSFAQRRGLSVKATKAEGLCMRELSERSSKLEVLFDERVQIRDVQVFQTPILRYEGLRAFESRAAAAITDDDLGEWWISAEACLRFPSARLRVEATEILLAREDEARKYFAAFSATVDFSKRNSGIVDEGFGGVTNRSSDAVTASREGYVECGGLVEFVVLFNTPDPSRMKGVQRLPCGKAVTILAGAPGQFTKVRTDDDREGFVNSSFLREGDAPKVPIDNAKKYDDLVEKYNELVEKYNSFLRLTQTCYTQAIQCGRAQQNISLPTVPEPQKRLYCSTTGASGMAFTTCYEQ